jgi:hypothetical protein
MMMVMVAISANTVFRYRQIDGPFEQRIETRLIDLLTLREIMDRLVDLQFIFQQQLLSITSSRVDILC